MQGSVRTTIVLDEQKRPVAVQIAYSDWLEIERRLNLASEKPKTMNPSQFAGVISLTEDPLAYQQSIRGEWR